MGVTRQRLEKNIRLYKGTVAIGCADGADETVDIEEIPTRCIGSGGVITRDPGDASYSLSIKGIYTRYTTPDAATNVSADQFWSDAVAGTEVTIIIGGAASGDTIKTYVAWIKSVKINHAIGSVSTYDVQFNANSCVQSTRP